MEQFAARAELPPFAWLPGELLDPNAAQDLGFRISSLGFRASGLFRTWGLGFRVYLGLRV